MSNHAPGFEKHPNHRVDISHSDARVRVYAGNTLIAESNAALLVDESRHNKVFYLPRDDVDMNQLKATDTSTYCPFKGHASYFSVASQGGDLNDSVWSYEQPFSECQALQGCLAFYADRFDVQIDEH